MPPTLDNNTQSSSSKDVGEEHTPKYIVISKKRLFSKCKFKKKNLIYNHIKCVYLMKNAYAMIDIIDSAFSLINY